MEKEDLKRIADAVQALAIKLTPFDGQDWDDWFLEFQEYCQKTNNASSKKLSDGTPNPNYGVNELNILKSHLVGPAKYYFKTLKDDQEYDKVISAFKSRFGLSANQKFSQKIATFGLRQQNSETLEMFVNRVQLKSKNLDLSEEDLVSLCIYGSHKSIKNFLLAVAPTTILQLVQCPFAQYLPSDFDAMGQVNQVEFEPDDFETCQHYGATPYLYGEEDVPYSGDQNSAEKTPSTSRSRRSNGNYSSCTACGYEFDKVQKQNSKQ